MTDAPKPKPTRKFNWLIFPALGLCFAVGRTEVQLLQYYRSLPATPTAAQCVSCVCVAHDRVGYSQRLPASEEAALAQTLGPFALNAVAEGDCRKLILDLPDESLDVIVTSPPYWGQRMSEGTGVEDDPRRYVEELRAVFRSLLPKLKPSGLLWVNIGDAYNTPINWREKDHEYSSLGPDQAGLAPTNSAYTKPRHKRRAFLEADTPWLTYGNLLGLPYRLVIGMQDDGWLSRGEVIWRKRNPMPEGKCRRPHRYHESIYLFARDEHHSFRTAPPVGSVWEFSNEKIDGVKHFSRFPEELPRRCLEAYGMTGEHIVAFDPFSGSGTTGVAAMRLGMSYVGFEIDPEQVEASNARIATACDGQLELFAPSPIPAVKPRKATTTPSRTAARQGSARDR